MVSRCLPPLSCGEGTSFLSQRIPWASGEQCGADCFRTSMEKLPGPRENEQVSRLSISGPVAASCLLLPDLVSLQELSRPVLLQFKLLPLDRADTMPADVVGVLLGGGLHPGPHCPTGLAVPSREGLVTQSLARGLPGCSSIPEDDSVAGTVLAFDSPA